MTDRLRWISLLYVIIAAGWAARNDPGFTDEITIRAVSLNIYHDRDDWQTRLEVIADTMQTIAPDIICMQEVLQHEDLRNQAEALADRLGYHYHFTSVDDADRLRRYGNAILSPHPFQDTNFKALKPFDDYRNVGHVRLYADGADVDVFCTHLHHLPTDEGGAVRAVQIDDLLGFISDVATSDMVILAGDFNAEPHYPEMAALSERFLDAYESVHGDGERPTTLNLAYGHDPRWIDYIYIEKDADAIVDTVRRVFTSPVGDTLWASDHFAVMTDIRMRLLSTTPGRSTKQ